MMTVHFNRNFADVQSVKKRKSLRRAVVMALLAGTVPAGAWAETKTLELRPDAATGKDATLFSLVSNGIIPWTGKPWNGANSPCFYAIAWTWDGRPGADRSLIQFDFSSIPQNAKIISAKLSLYKDVCSVGINTLSGSNAAWLQRVTSPWEEATVSWQNQPSTTTANQVIIPEIPYPHHPESNPFRQDLLDIDVMPLVSDMVANPASNFGMLFRLQSEQFYRAMSFSSSDATDPNLRPKLVVTYEQTPAVSLTVTKTGNGTLTSIPAGIDCGTDCTENYALNTEVKLTVASANGYRFANWTGDCTSDIVVMDKSKNCTAIFNITPVNNYTASGQLLGKTGIPLGNVTIHIGEKTTTTDAAGNWSLNGLTAGKYDIVATKGKQSCLDSGIELLDNGQYQQVVNYACDLVTYGDDNASFIAIWQFLDGNLQYVDTVSVEDFDAKFQEGKDYEIVDSNGEYLLEGLDDAGNTTSKIEVVRTR